MRDIFSESNFAIEVISKGGFVDSVVKGRRVLVQAEVIRMNHVAMAAWFDSEVRDDDWADYDTEQEREDCQNRKKAMRDECEAKIAALLRIDTEKESLSITRSLSEFFTVVHMMKIDADEDNWTQECNGGDDIDTQCNKS